MTWSKRAIAACDAELDSLAKQRQDVYTGLSDVNLRWPSTMGVSARLDLEALDERENRAYDLMHYARTRRA